MIIKNTGKTQLVGSRCGCERCASTAHPPRVYVRASRRRKRLLYEEAFNVSPPRGVTGAVRNPEPDVRSRFHEFLLVTRARGAQCDLIQIY